MPDVPRAQELLRLRPHLGRQVHGPASHANPLEERHAGVAVLPQDPGVDRPRVDPERLRDPRPQTKAVVQRVAEHPRAVDPGASLDPRAERVDGIRDHDERPGPAADAGERLDELFDDLRVREHVLVPRHVDGQRRRCSNDDDVGVDELVQLAPADRPGAPLLEHLLEVHHVGRHHLRTPVDEDDLVRCLVEQEVERRGGADSAPAAENRDLHPSRPSATDAACCSIAFAGSSRLIRR